MWMPILSVVVFVHSAYVLLHRLKRSGIASRTRACHTLFVLFILYQHWYPSLWFAHSIGAVILRKPQAVADGLCIDQALLPPGIALPLWMISLLAATIVCVLTYGEVKGRAGSWSLIVKYLPLIYALDSWLAYIKMVVVPDNPNANTLFALLFTQVVYLVLFGWVYVLMFFFYRRSTTAILFADARRERDEETGNAALPD